MCFRKSRSNTYTRGTCLVGNNETSSYLHKYIFFHTSFVIYQTHDWYPWIVFNPLMILVLSKSRALKYKCHVYVHIREIYVQTYYGNLKSDRYIMIHPNERFFLHEIHSTYQFMDYGLAEHGTYPKAFKNRVIHQMYIVHRDHLNGLVDIHWQHWSHGRYLLCRITRML